MLQSVNIELYRNVFLHAAVFQGLFAGLVAGVMGEGRLSAGIKHSLVMLIIAYLGFTLMFGYKFF
jgi:flagellar protein FlaJ